MLGRGMLGATYSDTAVAADDRDADGGSEREISEDLGDERPCADNVESGHAEDPSGAGVRKVHRLFNEYSLLGVKDAVLLEDLNDDGDSRVDRVGNDEHGGVGRGSRDACREIAHDAGVDLDQ